MDDLASVTSHSMTGNTLSIAANRLSYVLDLHGPSVAVDTACSSSLVALHHACNSLRSGESSIALVGGVNILLHPFPFIGFTKASMLSANGRCRAFDASGAGYVRGEGCAVFVLKPLHKAVADGDNIQAVILATGVNSDGGRKTSLTIPSANGQAELMRGVLSRSGLSADDVDYVEAHGTGTAVGDPIETAAIGEVYGRPRKSGRPLPIGSVKTNLGHLEPASGLAGLAKAILILKNRAIPPSLHFKTPNPHIDFTGLNIDVVTQVRPFDQRRAKLVVGVNSFGFGGANAHALVQEFRPELQAQVQTEPGHFPLFLSARDPQALRELAARYAELIKQEPQNYYDIAYGAAMRRERLERRLAINTQTVEQTVHLLEAFAKGQTAPQVVTDDALTQPGAVAFVYSGNGSQWLGMGRRLMAESPRFAEIMANLDALIVSRAGFSVIEELQAEAAASMLDDTAVAQPLLFSMQVALTTMLRERGITPHAVAGHSVGEIAAAWAAGALSLEDAVEVICARSAAQALTGGMGRMAVVGLSEVAATQWVTSPEYAAIEIAGINSPDNVTLSGPVEVLERLGAMLAPRNVFFRMLDLDYAFHSRAMDAIKDGLVSHLAPLTPSDGSSATYVSTVTGGVLNGSELGANYWWLNVRQPVQFAKSIATLAKQGCRVFIEIGPHAILQRYIRDSLKANDMTGRVLPTLRNDDDSLARLEEAALRIHLVLEPHGLNAFFPHPGRHIRLPNYPWQRERHWHPRSSESKGILTKRRVHPLLGWRVKGADAVWSNTIDPDTCPWLADHKVANAIVFPGSAYVELALAAAREHFGGTGHEVEEIDIMAAMVFDGEHARDLRFELTLRDGGFRVLSRQRLSDDPWTVNALGRLTGEPARVSASRLNTAFQSDEPLVAIDHLTHYRLAKSVGLSYGPCFQGLGHLAVQGRTLLATLVVPPAVQNEAASYLIHPAILDVCFQSLVAFFQKAIESEQGVPYLPVRVGRIRLYSAATIVQFKAHLLRQGSRSVLASFELFDSAGHTVATLDACRFRAAPAPRRKAAQPACWTSRTHLKPLAVEQLVSKVLPSRVVSRNLHSWFTQAEPTLNRAAYFGEASPLFEAMTVAFVRDAFAANLAQPGSALGQMLSQPHLAEPNLRPYFDWMVTLLRQEGLLVQDTKGAWSIEHTDLPPAPHIWRTLLRDFPANLPELVLAARIGRQLPNLLVGQMVSPGLMDALNASQQFEAFFDDSPAYLGTRLAVQQVLIAAAAEWPAHRRLRVLEVVTGTSTSLKPLVAKVPGIQMDYVVAHDNVETHASMSAEYSDYPFVVVAKVEGDALTLVADSPIPDRFDFIILQHTLHRAANPVGVLAAARQYLARGGMLMVAERYPDAAADFIFGLTPHWWHHRADGGFTSRLNGAKVWQQALSEQGFADVGVFNEAPTEGLSTGAYLVLAKRPEADPVPVIQLSGANWLLVCQSAGPTHALADTLGRHLQSQGQRIAVATVLNGGVELSGQSLCLDLENPTSATALLATAGANLGQVDHVVYLADLGASASIHLTGVLHLVQALTRLTVSPRLWLVTAGGALVEGLARRVSPDTHAAALWGLGRVVMNECPALVCSLIDLDIDPVASDTALRLQSELLQPDSEREIILTANGRHVVRMDRAPQAAQCGADAVVASRFRLDFRVPGQLRNLVWLPQAQEPLAKGDVEVRVVTTGLNFRDVMYLMGLLPDEAVENGFSGANLGLEFAGVVTRVQADVREFAVGDAVIGFGSACFASHVVTQSTALVHKPVEWSFEAAATVPTVFFTVYYALKQLADLQAGERVLIHGAAGGVGIAAVQLALHLGAEIFATVGSEEKREFVALLGADHVFDSRSLTFADDILAITAGEGVDVVLNSLAGEAIRRNFRVLKPFGRFLELGKRDFFENTPIGLRPFKDNISYFGIDADQLLSARPALAGRLFREVMALFREGVLFPLPYRLFTADHVVDAFRAMQQSRHIGKVVVRIEDACVAVEPAPAAKVLVQFSPASTWIVVGGISGFGLESARWLAERGVGRLLLVSRRGAQTPGAAQAMQSLQALGATVELVACDITDSTAVQAMLNQALSNGHPLKGILHSAMVLDDALIGNLDRARMLAVLAPKMLGAWNLHNLTLGIPLEYFVLYSSVTTAIGNPGQANYVAANASLEGLAALRRSLGLPATCIAWGPIGDAGYLTRNQAVKDSLTSSLGAEPLLAREALAMLDQLLQGTATTTTVANFDWSALSRLLPSAQTPRFDVLRAQAGPASQAHHEGADIHTLIAGKSSGEVRNIISTLITQEVALVLCVSADRIDPNRSLYDLGMDSLMGVELALGLEKRFGIQLPAMMLSEGPSVDRVTTRIVAKIAGNTDTLGDVDEERRIGAVITEMAAQHGEALTDDEFNQTVEIMRHHATARELAA